MTAAEKQVLKQAQAIIVRELLAEKAITITNLGRFEVRDRKVHLPLSGEARTVATVRFRACLGLKAAVQSA